jgi:ribosomal protein L29
VAVESIAQKLEKCSDNGKQLVVFGSDSRVGDTAKKYLLMAKCYRLPRVLKLKLFALRMEKASEELQTAIANVQHLQAKVCKRLRNVLWQRAWVAYMKARCSLPQWLKDWALRVSQAGEKRAHILALASRSEVLQNAPIMLCTIASTRLLLKQWEESFTIVEPTLASCTREMAKDKKDLAERIATLKLELAELEMSACSASQGALSTLVEITAQAYPAASPAQVLGWEVHLSVPEPLQMHTIIGAILRVNLRLTLQ